MGTDIRQRTVHGPADLHQLKILVNSGLEDEGTQRSFEHSGKH